LCAKLTKSSGGDDGTQHAHYFYILLKSDEHENDIKRFSKYTFYFI